MHRAEAKAIRSSVTAQQAHSNFCPTTPPNSTEHHHFPQTIVIPQQTPGPPTFPRSQASNPLANRQEPPVLTKRKYSNQAFSCVSTSFHLSSPSHTGNCRSEFGGGVRCAKPSFTSAWRILEVAQSAQNILQIILEVYGGWEVVEQGTPRRDSAWLSRN